MLAAAVVLGVALMFFGGRGKNEVKTDEIFISEDVTVWICSNCGHIHVGPKAPELCPVCQHPKAYFQKKVNKF